MRATNRKATAPLHELTEDLPGAAPCDHGYVARASLVQHPELCSRQCQSSEVSSWVGSQVRSRSSASG